MGNMAVARLSKRKELGKEMKTWKMRDDQLLAYHALVEHDRRWLIRLQERMVP